MKKEKSCGVICFKETSDEIKVLLIRHRYGGHWSFPKGHVEKGETETETALRELLEETSAHVNLLDGYRETTIYSPSRNVSKEVVFFTGLLTSSDFTCQPQEVSEISLTPLATAYERLSFETDRALLQKAESFLRAYLASA